MSNQKRRVVVVLSVMLIAILGLIASNNSHSEISPRLQALQAAEDKRIVAANFQHDNLSGGPTGEDALVQANAEIEVRNKNAILVFVSIFDIGSILTLVAAYRAKRFRTVVLFALIAALIGELVSALIRPAYAGPVFLPYRIIAQLIVASCAYGLKHVWQVRQRKPFLKA